MNPSTAGLWNNPPPPGLEDEQDLSHCDRPYDKSPPAEHDKKHRERHRRRSRSRSRDRSRRHRSRSKRRHRRSRSRHRHRSRSISRSVSRDRSKHRHKERRRRRSHSKSRRSRSRSRRRHHHSSKKSYSRSPSIKTEPLDQAEEEEETEENKNTFKNDGSFLELYKKMQEEQQKAQQIKVEAAATEVKRPMFGKRRGGRVLKTGIVVKTKQEEEAEAGEPQDPWSIYLKEVKRYKEACCDDDSKTRPLVK